ncbi:hypothetical protein HZU73_07596 [Apis mellifera caucasica]|nr:hypothetical protein HZU73_07596 [Apis mellifera caucasica]
MSIKYYAIARGRTSGIYICCCLTSLILKKVWSDDAYCPKSAPNSNTLWMHLFFANHTGFSEPQILAINKTIEALKMCVNILYKIFGRQIFIIFKILFNNEDMLLYRITLIFTNPKLSAVKLFFFLYVNNLMQK